MAIEWQDVDSSMVARVGYDPAEETLGVQFKNGAVYQYTGVPQDAFDALLAAPSHGKHINTHIKGVYPFERVE